MQILRRQCVVSVAIAGLALLVADVAGAQPPSRSSGDRSRTGGLPNPDFVIGRFDQNGDSRLNKNQVPEGFWNWISDADANNDGSVTKDELAKASTGNRRPSRDREARSTQSGYDMPSQSIRISRSPSLNTATRCGFRF